MRKIGSWFIFISAIVNERKDEQARERTQEGGLGPKTCLRSYFRNRDIESIATEEGERMDGNKLASRFHDI